VPSAQPPNSEPQSAENESSASGQSSGPTPPAILDDLTPETESETPPPAAIPDNADS
jgi:hypothetical protein